MDSIEDVRGRHPRWLTHCKQSVQTHPHRPSPCCVVPMRDSSFVRKSKFLCVGNSTRDVRRIKEEGAFGKTVASTVPTLTAWQLIRRAHGDWSLIAARRYINALALTDVYVKSTWVERNHLYGNEQKPTHKISPHKKSSILQ